MTDEELDELVSAYLDGEVTDEERARVEADPELASRVAALRSITARLAAPVDPPAARDRWIAAAVSSLPTPVAPRRPRWLAPASAVAAIAACFGLVVGMNQLGRGSSDSATNSAGSSEAFAQADAAASATIGAAVDDKSGQGTAAAAPAGPPSTSASRLSPATTAGGAPADGKPGFLGDFRSDTDLLVALRAALPTTTRPQTLAQTELACNLEGPRSTARVAGRDVLVGVVGAVVSITDIATCATRNQTL